MKRNDLIIVCTIMLSGLVLYAGLCKLMGYQILGDKKASSLNAPLQSEHVGEAIPGIEILLSDSATHFNMGSIKESAPVVVFLFGPDCPYCHRQMDEIIRNINKLRHIKFYLVTVYPYNDMKRFFNVFHLGEYSNIVVGTDFNFSFIKYFNSNNIPYIAIYDRNKMLKATFTGCITSDVLIEYSGLN